LELQRELDDKKAEFNHREDRERSKGIDMLKIQSRNKTMTQDLEEFRKKVVRNQGHLIEALRQNEYL
jgi:predicted  nucleic acid-binding Zn-ribbon protein